MKETLRRRILQGVKLGLIAKNRFLFDNRETLMQGDSLQLAAMLLAQMIVELPIEVLACGGVGGLPLASAIKTLLPKLNICFVRKQSKGYDLDKLVEGPPIKANSQVWVVDDLINRGKTFDRVTEAIKQVCPSCHIKGLLVLVDYGKSDGSQRLRAAGYEVKRLFGLRDLGLVARQSTDGHLIPKWANPLTGSTATEFIRSTPAISGDRLVIGTDFTGWICCDKTTGEVLWRFDSPHKHVKGVAAAPQIADDRVITASYDGLLRCLCLANGSPYWEVKAGAYLHSTPQLVDGRVYVGTENSVGGNHRGEIICTALSDGAALWGVTTDGLVPCTPLVSGNRVFCGSNDGHLYAVHPDDGTLLWKHPSRGAIKGQPALGRHLVFTCTEQGWLQAWNHDGKNVWSRKVSAALRHFRPMIQDDLVIVGARENMLVAYDQESARIRWLKRLRGQVIYGLTRRNERDGFCITKNGYFTALNLATGKTRITQHVTDAAVNQPIVYDHPMIYITTDRQGLLAFALADTA